MNNRFSILISGYIRLQLQNLMFYVVSPYSIIVKVSVINYLSKY